jgi:hypothetical protein
VGSLASGISYINTDFLMAGWEFDCLRRFRDRLYSRFGLKPKEKKHGVYQGLIIDNKRFRLADRLMLKSLCGQFNDFLNLSYVDLVDFKEYQAQLRLFSQADLYITASGTGYEHAFTLGDRSVAINLWDHNGVPWNNINSERVMASATWIKVFYYPNNGTRESYRNEILVSLINTGLNYLMNGSWPVPLYSNFDLGTKAFMQACSGIIKNFCPRLMREARDLNSPCISAIPTQFLTAPPTERCRRYLGATAHHCMRCRFDTIICANGTNVTCPNESSPFWGRVTFLENSIS